MIALVYAAYLFAGLIIPNGLLHFIHGILGKRIPSEYFPISKVTKKTDTEKSEPTIIYKMGGLFRKYYGFNAIWGLMWIIAAFVILNLVGTFKPGITWDTGLFFLGILIGSFTVGKGWNDYEKKVE